MSQTIHATAIVSSSAIIGEGVTIGPFCIVEDNVVIGNGTTLMSHIVVGTNTTIGADCTVFPHACIGLAPQDLKYAGEPTKVVIGDRTTIRESVTINRGTTALGLTTVGSDCLLMAYAHVAHDCVLGNHVILANSVNLGGHVEIGDWAILGGLTGIHQFVRVGAHAMVGAISRLVQDVPPYTLTGKMPQATEGVNVIGMRRRGFSEADITLINEFYHTLYRRGLNVTAALTSYEAEHPEVHPLVADIITFIRTSKRGISRSALSRS